MRRPAPKSSLHAAGKGPALPQLAGLASFAQSSDLTKEQIHKSLRKLPLESHHLNSLTDITVAVLP